MWEILLSTDLLSTDSNVFNWPGGSWETDRQTDQNWKDYFIVFTAPVSSSTVPSFPSFTVMHLSLFSMPVAIWAWLLWVVCYCLHIQCLNHQYLSKGDRTVCYFGVLSTNLLNLIYYQNCRHCSVIFGRPLGLGLCHRKSVRPSVRPSVTLVYCGQTA